MRGERKHTIRIAAAVGLLVLLVAAAWALQARFAGRDTYAVTISANGRTLRTFSVPELEGVGVRTVKMLGRDEKGPRLLAVLDKAGVTDFTRVTILGEGVRDTGRLVLQRSQVDGNVLLDIANRGTVKVAGPDIPWGDRVRDITAINVER